MGLKKKCEIVRDLGYFYPEWQDWQLTHDAFISPNGEVFDINWLKGLHWTFQKYNGQRADLRQENNKLRAEIAELKAILPKVADVIEFPCK